NQVKDNWYSEMMINKAAKILTSALIGSFVCFLRIANISFSLVCAGCLLRILALRPFADTNSVSRMAKMTSGKVQIMEIIYRDTEGLWLPLRRNFCVISI